MNDKILRIWNDPRRKPILLGLIAFNAGIGLGYILGRRNKPIPYVMTEQLEMKFDVDKLHNEFAKLRDVSEPRTSTVNKHTEIPEYTSSPSTKVIDGESFVTNKIKETLETARDAVQEVKEGLEDDEEVLVRRSIFVEGDDWNYEVELTKRNTDDPYVIHRDEFYGEESGFTQVTLTFYAGDDILVDEDESPIYNHELITGPLLFGHGSGDQNVVHIRNPKRKAEYEVVRDPGLYSVEILGLEIENNQRVKDLKHSRNRKLRPE